MTMDVDNSPGSPAATTTTYEQVSHKKASGKLVLTVESITFEPEAGVPMAVSWSDIAKHQVSPTSYPKAMLKLVWKNGKSTTYQFPSRPELERIRLDINERLQTSKAVNQSAPTSGKKRAHSETIQRVSSTSFGELDPTALAVTRSSLLAANPTLRAQHHYLVQETATVSEDDFWKTHNDLLEEEYARISGMTKAGSSSLLQSHLQLLTGRVTLGVEEMRQIFILYPAVHRAYEEKVPLELSDEQFWRKYLESEYFHRDRGRLGAASRQGRKDGQTKSGTGKLSLEDQEARAAAVGTDDIFSRYDQKLREASKQEDSSRRKWGTKLAVGQFDLASTFETERGQLLEGARDNHPANADDAKGTKVIQKYNRHWAMVLHPEDAVAGSDLLQVSRRSVDDVLSADSDAKAQGGVDDEMYRLVGFAQSSSGEANHALGIGLAESDEYEQLTLKNIEAYYSARPANSDSPSQADDDATRKRNGLFANNIVSKLKAMVTATRESNQGPTASSGTIQFKDAFPPPELGKELLGALTKKMAADSKTDEDALAVVNALPEDFKKRLHSYFRRSSELLRHFFGLRRLVEASQGMSSANAYTQKQRKIVTGMETVYREMDGMRKELEATRETGELMRKMCLQIMDQLDWAFKLHREGTGGGGGGGFVTIEEF